MTYLLDGILNVDKPQNMTSFDVIAILRRKLGIKKIGHTGTLDPMATGVLPICIGRSTKFIEYMDEGSKTYVATLQLGKKTNTDDIWGEELATQEITMPTENEFLDTFQKFTGSMLQIPPMISAKKINGKPLYKYARNGENIDPALKAKLVTIYSIDLIKYDYENKEVTFIAEVSRGTYIRSLCVDIAKSFSMIGTMSYIRRIKSSALHIDTAIKLADILNMDYEELAKQLIKPHELIKNIGEIKLDKVASERFLQGIKLKKADYDVVKDDENSLYNVFGKTDNYEGYLGVGHSNENGILKSEKLFYIG